MRPPVLRPEATTNSTLTWGEFLEAGWVREYRHTHQVPLQTLRRYLADRRERDGKRYPLAYRQPFVIAGPSLAETADTGTDNLVVSRYPDGQMVLDPRAKAFVSHVVFADIGDAAANKIAAQWLPAPTRFPDVKVDPLRSSGRPTVDGIRTEILHEFVTAGDAVPQLAKIYEMEPSLIRQATDFEQWCAEEIRAA